ncbi:hypothetical protein C8J56DRAFT_136268 [Mycena floridula]|nr:hypothetical protein C8J56DRAFT_136268 [Mycena floridula]
MSGKGIPGVPTLELATSASAANKTVAASEQVKNTMRIVSGEVLGRHWQFVDADPDTQVHGMTFAADQRPEVEFRIIEPPVPESLYVETSVYWSLPCPICQNLCHVVALRIPLDCWARYVQSQDSEDRGSARNEKHSTSTILGCSLYIVVEKSCVQRVGV